MKKILALLSLPLAISCMAAGDWRKIDGEIAISHSPLSDPDSKKPVVAYVVIKGSAAKLMYQKMKTAKEQFGYCSEPKLAVKVAGNLQCVKDGTSYSCDVGINLQNGKSEFGRSC